MTQSQPIALVSGANRGIGLALVETLLERGAQRVYAGARDPQSLSELVQKSAGKVIPLRLDVTNRAQVAEAAQQAKDITLLINNAGRAAFGNALDSSDADIEGDMLTNYFGTLSMLRAFVPVLKANSGALANLLSVVSLAPIPGIAGYSASKAALWSLTLALRENLRADKVAVHGIYPGPVDTDMAKDFQADKSTPASVAAAILDGIAAGTEDIYPDPMSRQVHEIWQTDPKELQRFFAAF
jgi:NAD(P)-dependent dehydrogenase (short-subunit alcohol dehydrogenase family)